MRRLPCGSVRAAFQHTSLAPIPGSAGCPVLASHVGNRLVRCRLARHWLIGVKGAGRRVCGGLPPGAGAAWFSQCWAMRRRGVLPARDPVRSRAAWLCGGSGPRGPVPGGFVSLLLALRTPYSPAVLLADHHPSGECGRPPVGLRGGWEAAGPKLLSPSWIPQTPCHGPRLRPTLAPRVSLRAKALSMEETGHHSSRPPPRWTALKLPEAVHVYPGRARVCSY